jgi:hypothetical protein
MGLFWTAKQEAHIVLTTTSDAECKVEEPRMCKVHDPESLCPELKAHNSFTINAAGQPGSNGTSLARACPKRASFGNAITIADPLQSHH